MPVWCSEVKVGEQVSDARGFKVSNGLRPVFGDHVWNSIIQPQMFINLCFEVDCPSSEGET